MHELFTQVLSKKDLSKAGDLFTVSDQSIVADLTEVVNKIAEITSLSDYVNNDNDQSVVEICITRVTTAIRETGTMQQHADSLVALLESCLNHSLKPSAKDEDPPHAKIAADIISCLFLNYSKKDVMERALPVAVKFLHKGNRELSRNMSSYLSLAAIENADLLARHIQLIIDSILAGNYPLCRVLPQVYAVDHESLHAHAMALVSLLPLCDNPDKLALLNLFALMASNDAALLEPCLPQLTEYLSTGPTAAATMLVLLNMAASKPQLLVDHVAKIKRAAERHPNTLCLAAQVISLVGKLSQDRAQEALDFVLQHLPKADRGSQGTLLREATLLCTSYPVLFTDKMLAEVRHRNTANSSSNVNQTSTGVTIVKVGGSHQNSATQTQPQPQYAPGGRPAPSDSAWSNRVVVCRPRLGGDSRSTGRLHASAAHRSMTRLNMAGGSRAGSVGGLHKSLTRLSSSQQINAVPPPAASNNRSITAIGGSQQYSLQPPPPFSRVTITTGVKQGGSVDRDLVLSISSSAPPLALASHGTHRDTAGLKSSAATLPLSRSGPVAVNGVTQRRAANTSVTLLNGHGAVAAQRMSVFEPYPMRDTVQHFCEKHLDKIKAYMDKVAVRIPPPAKCTIEERRAKKLAKLHFACQGRGEHCLYSRTFFTMRTRHPRVWIHLMFLALQARCQSALSSRDASVSALKNCWDILKCENKTFLTLVTSAFPCTKDQDLLLTELRHSGFFDVFECVGGVGGAWGCFLCNHPERAVGFLQDSQPVIEGQLQEKKGRWRLFRRWRTRYFTLSGAHLTFRGSKDDKEVTQFDVNQIRSVKVSRGARNIPKAFEIFTGDQSLILKPKGGKNAEEWVQCLSIVVAHSHSRDTPATAAAKTNSLPARGVRTAV